MIFHTAESFVAGFITIVAPTLLLLAILGTVFDRLWGRNANDAASNRIVQTVCAIVAVFILWELIVGTYRLVTTGDTKIDIDLRRPSDCVFAFIVFCLPILYAWNAIRLFMRAGR